MSIATERLINGLLKGLPGDLTPEQAQRMLTTDVEIVAPAHRAHASDLWPAIWALAAALERELYGAIFIRCGLTAPLPSPSRLGSRCHFVDSPQLASLSIFLGADADVDSKRAIVGDARGQAIAVGTRLDRESSLPTPIECFVLSGFLGFAVIGRLFRMPDNKRHYTQPILRVIFDSRQLAQALGKVDGFTCIGLGQIGQAYLALIFFLYDGRLGGRRFALVDDDKFQRENGRTQLLLADGDDWLNKEKVPYIGSAIGPWGVDVIPVREKIGWTWRRDARYPAFALLGLHDLEARRMASDAGFSRMIESGVGTDLLQPRVSWHAFPGDRALGRRLFPEPASALRATPDINADWADELKGSPGGCGWVEFKGVSATAPCLGIVAAAFALAELGNCGAVISGSCLLWSQCVPVLREVD